MGVLGFGQGDNMMIHGQKSEAWLQCTKTDGEQLTRVSQQGGV
jgi:hypothetical protein